MTPPLGALMDIDGEYSDTRPEWSSTLPACAD